jgi:hypothetical protein
MSAAADNGKAPTVVLVHGAFADGSSWKARSHPWISQEVPVRGFVFDVKTGRLSEVFADGETTTGG